MTINDIAAQFHTAGINYSTAIQPYATKLFVALLLIDILVSWIQFTAEGQLDASHFLGRLIKHMLSGGFIYLMIVNAYTWMSAVIRSFSSIGAAITGLPALNPQTVLQIGTNMASVIFNSPANASLMTNLEEAIVQSVAAFVVLFSFVITSAILLLTLIEAYLVIGGGVILLGLGANRFTAPAAEGYFGYVIRVGVRLLFFYLVLAIGVQMANQWSAALASACKPVTATLPWYATYGVPPTSIVTTVCSATIPAADMLSYTAFSFVFMVVCIAVPQMAASIAGGTVGLALTHAFEAAYVAQTVIRPITGALQSGFNRIARGLSSDGDSGRDQTDWLRTVELSQHAQRTASLASNASPRVPAPANPRATCPVTPNSRGTRVLNPSTRPVSQSNGTKAIGRPTTTTT